MASPRCKAVVTLVPALLLLAAVGTANAGAPASGLEGILRGALALGSEGAPTGPIDPAGAKMVSVELNSKSTVFHVYSVVDGLHYSATVPQGGVMNVGSAAVDLKGHRLFAAVARATLMVFTYADPTKPALVKTCALGATNAQHGVAYSNAAGKLFVLTLHRWSAGTDGLFELDVETCGLTNTGVDVAGLAGWNIRGMLNGPGGNVVHPFSQGKKMLVAVSQGMDQTTPKMVVLDIEAKTVIDFTPTNPGGAAALSGVLGDVWSDFSGMENSDAVYIATDAAVVIVDGAASTAQTVSNAKKIREAVMDACDKLLYVPPKSESGTGTLRSFDGQVTWTSPSKYTTSYGLAFYDNMTGAC